MGKWSQRAEQIAGRPFDISDNSDISPPRGGEAGPNVTIVTNVKAVPASRSAILVEVRTRLATLDPDKPRGGLAPGLWSSLVYAAADLFNDFAGQALGLGWGPVDLFGVVPERPTYGGLVARMADGWRVVALDANRAAIRGRYGGSPGWYYRRTVPGSVLPWELPA